MSSMYVWVPLGSSKSTTAVVYRRLLVSGPTFQLGPLGPFQLGLLRPFESRDNICGTLAEARSGAGACVAGSGALGGSR